MNEIKIIDITPENILEYGVCGYKSLKKEGFPEKVAWLTENYPKGLRIKSILTGKDGIQGMIEYIPGEYCWKPVEANGYVFIHCLFVGFKSTYKNKGYATLLIDECIKAAKEAKKNGVAVVTRKGSFMVGNEIFMKNGFEIAAEAPPDFELLVLKFKKNIQSPKFKENFTDKTGKYKNGLTIIRADQCPYTKKNVNEIVETSKKVFGITPVIVDYKNHTEAQDCPCAFGSFCIVYNGKILSYHPISNGRFKNIMNAITAGKN